jgi:hypothetical protein
MVPLFQALAARARRQGRGALFDAAIFAANLLLVEPLTDLVKGTRGFHPLFGALLALAVVLFAAGAGWKRAPLQARLAGAPRPAMPGGMYLVFLVLFVMQWGLFGSCLAYGLEILGPRLGLNEINSVAAALLVMGGSLAPVLIAVWAMLPPRYPPTPSAALVRRELRADLALYAACVIFMVFWNGVFVESLAGAAAHHWLMRGLLVILVTVPFAIFYLAPRALFLAEDYRSSGPWLGALLAMAPLALRLVFGG